ncbi:MAG: hypothetical protein ACFE0Q_12260 [Anaerolineae bacterium]
MTDVTLITSLYQSAGFLPQYIAQAQALAREVAQAGVGLEFVIIPNNASDEERALLTGLEKVLVAEGIASVQIHYVTRETLYASWNRGMGYARGASFGIWNVDDQRTPQGVIAGHRALANGADLIDLAFNINKGGQVKRHAPQYRPDSLAPRTAVSPFFMFHRRLWQRAGAFIPHFRIVGDFEWSKRAIVREAQVQRSDVIAGTFNLHADNLSGGTPTEWVEFNIALLMHDAPELMRPVDPSLMRQYWEDWGQEVASISEEHARWLWGDGAQARYERYQWERNLHPFARRILLALARRGWAYSLDWELHHGR